jgi:hypothetical protein
MVDQVLNFTEVCILKTWPSKMPMLYILQAPCWLILFEVSFELWASTGLFVTKPNGEAELRDKGRASVYPQI